MKKNLFLMCILFSMLSFTGFAQIVLKSENKLADSLSYRENFDYVIKKFDKSKFATNILYDRVVPLANLLNYSPLIPKDTSNYTHFIQAYYEMFLASFNNTNMKLFTEIKTEVLNKNALGVIPIGIVDYAFNYVDSNAFKNGDIEIENKQLKIKKGNFGFIKKSEACVFSLLAEKLKLGENIITFDNMFVFSNSTVSIISLELNFGKENGSFVFRLGDTKNVNIVKSGTTTLSYSLTLSNGQKYSGYSKIEVEGSNMLKSAAVSASNINPCETLSIQSAEAYSDYAGVSKTGVADVFVYYSDCALKTLQRPVIICDGFDPSDVRKGQDIYDMMNKAPYFLADNLRANGFDVIIVNFPVGADYIVRNAYVMIDVIKWVNQRKTTKLKNIVIGPSMGGLVTRYALAKMEKDGFNHQTALWVSFDSPQQGANIAIGDQYFLDFFGRVVNNAGANEGLAKINTPAAKQMLIDHYSKPWNNEAPECSWYRNSFNSELISNGVSGSKGYPLQLRKISLINGSGIGTKQEGIDNSTYLLTMDKWQSIIITSIKVAHAEISTSADLSFVRRSVLYAFTAKPNVYTQRWSRPSTSQYFTTSYDKAPGGNYPTQSIIATGNSDFTVYYSTHSFIPSVSSLDLTDPYLTLNIGNANIIQNKRTPFDSYFAPNENQEHVTYNAQSVTWLNNEINTAVPCVLTTLSGITYSSNTAVTDCRLTVNNVSITNSASVILDSEMETTITGDFEVKLGSSLSIN